ncbi:MAG: TolC family protein [Gemmataceae bacterium]|nr:TolC family protein [Gemmataceae bacterium]
MCHSMKRNALALFLAVSSQVNASAQPPAEPTRFGSERVTPARPAFVEVLPSTVLSHAVETKTSYSLDDLIRIALERHPRLAQAAFSIDAARGRALQAGLYPNPTIAAVFDELGDKTGSGGVNTLPQVNQEIVTGGKLTLSRAVAEREVDQATLLLAARRAELLAQIRTAYYDALTLDRRVTILRELRTVTQKSVDNVKELVKAKQAAQLDVVQLEVEAERIALEAEAAELELPAAFRRLAAAIGEKDLPQASLTESLTAPLPDYELDRIRAFVLEVHPDVRLAKVGIDRARLVMERARVEVIPNVTLSGGYVRQNQNKSNDWMVGISLPIPTWNRNQGNILASQASIGEATREVQRVELDLTERIASAYRDYAAARQRAKRLEDVRNKADEAFRLISGDKNFNFTTVQRLVAQQAVTQASLDQLRAQGEAWRAASVLSGLTLEEQWPAKLAVPAPKIGPDLAPRQR